MIQIKKYTVIYIKAYGRNSMKGLFKGSATALITPFDKGKIDYNSMERIIEHQISGGTHALVVCGTTGEVSTLSVAERKKLMLYCVEKCAGRIPVILGTGGNNTEACVKMSTTREQKTASSSITSAYPTPAFFPLSHTTCRRGQE